MEDSAADASQSFVADSDICQQLLTRYARSSAVQHRHLCATAAATRSIIQSSSLPLSPVSYFAATITSLSDSESLDADGLGALTSFLSIVLPLVGGGEIKAEKAGEAVRVLVRIVEDNGSRLGTSGVKAVVKCVGVLLAQYCNLNEWDSAASGFRWLLKFSLDKRPKVRKCALDCLLTVFKFESSVTSKASKSIYLLLKDTMPVAREMVTSTIIDGSKQETLLRPEHQEVLQMLNVMKHVVPHLSPKIHMKILPQLLRILTSQFSVATRYIFDVISAIFVNTGPDIIITNVENIFTSLVSYLSFGEKNPVDSVLFAASLAKMALGKLHDCDTSNWSIYFPRLIKSLAVLLSSKDDIALQISTMLRELIEHHIDVNNFNIESQDTEGNAIDNADFRAIESTCAIFYSLLHASSQIPNEHFLLVVSLLFRKLGKKSSIFMKQTLLKLGDLRNANPANASEIKHLEDCIGSAVNAMGPEKLLALLPISFSSKELSVSNIWLIPILRIYVDGSSLLFFMEHIVPLAEFFEKESCNVKNSVIGQDLQAYAHACWGLLPAFCRRPSDTYQSFGALAKLLISFIKKDSFMLEDIAVALQELVNENKGALASEGGSVQLIESPRTKNLNGSSVDTIARSLYSKKTARKNIKTLTLCAEELLQALTNVFFESPPVLRERLKGAIGCLGSLCNASLMKHLFMDSLKKYQLLGDVGEGEHGKVESDADGSIEKSDNQLADEKRCLLLDLASCIVEGSNDDLAIVLFSVIKRALQSSNEAVQIEAYRTLSRILEKNPSFCFSQFDVVLELLAGMKSASNSSMLINRFACLQPLLIHALMTNIDEENTKAFLILNEIILTLKDSDEEGRKAAYDVLNELSSKLRSSSDASLDSLYQKLLTMITGYLSGSSPHIKSGVVSALSVLVYNDPAICIKMPDIVPAVMELLHSKSVEVIKAVLGFVKVLVSCLESNDLQHFLSGIMDGVIRWSSVSRHHFKAKIVVILEIMIRKCGTAAVKALAPEKYKDFVQGVIENRHGKSSRKENRSEEATQEVSGSAPMRHGKRKRDESNFQSSKGNGKRAENPTPNGRGSFKRNRPLQKGKNGAAPNRGKHLKTTSKFQKKGPKARW